MAVLFPQELSGIQKQMEKHKNEDSERGQNQLTLIVSLPGLWEKKKMLIMEFYFIIILKMCLYFKVGSHCINDRNADLIMV